MKTLRTLGTVLGILFLVVALAFTAFHAFVGSSPPPSSASPFFHTVFMSGAIVLAVICVGAFYLVHAGTGSFTLHRMSAWTRALRLRIYAPVSSGPAPGFNLA